MMKKKLLFAAFGLLLTAGSVRAQSGVKYPYVESGKIIVSRDAAGGAKTSTVLSDAEKSFLNSKHAVYNEQASYNKVSPKFEVAASNTGSAPNWWVATGRIYANKDVPSGTGSDGSVCPAGWRLPTQRELMLIYVLKDQLTGITALVADFFWSGTEISSDNAWVVHMGDGNMYDRDKSYNNGTNVRCVKDL